MGRIKLCLRTQKTWLTRESVFQIEPALWHFIWAVVRGDNNVPSSSRFSLGCTLGVSLSDFLYILLGRNRLDMMYLKKNDVHEDSSWLWSQLGFFPCHFHFFTFQSLQLPLAHLSMSQSRQPLTRLPTTLLLSSSLLSSGSLITGSVLRLISSKPRLPLHPNPIRPPLCVCVRAGRHSLK